MSWPAELRIPGRFTGLLLCSLGLSACGSTAMTQSSSAPQTSAVGLHTAVTEAPYTTETTIDEVRDDPVFGDYGRLLFPVEEGYMSGSTLGDLQLVWYHNIDPKMTVQIVNYLYEQASSGQQIFYDIYTEAEKQADPDKADTGLFFFRGEENARTAVVSAGGGFAYVGAMQDSFPVSLELSGRGYNAFALIYRPDAEEACEDLSRAIAFLHENAQSLGIDMTDYSLWGGSAGARMANWVGTLGTGMFGEEEYPQPAIVVTQYSGISEVTGSEPPTYANVGTADQIAWYRTMEDRIDRLQEAGIDAEIDVFPGLAHGFGLGTGTAAEGWVDHAEAFWLRHMHTEEE